MCSKVFKGVGALSNHLKDRGIAPTGAIINHALSSRSVGYAYYAAGGKATHRSAVMLSLQSSRGVRLPTDSMQCYMMCNADCKDKGVIFIYRIHGILLNGIIQPET